jgi:uncharacterized protein (TIGR02594 family)
LRDLVYNAAPALHDLTGTQLEPAAYVQSQFFFDAAGNRARQWKTRTSTGSYKTESTLYLGSYEREIHSSSANPSITPSEHKRVHRHSLGDMVYTRTITPSTGETVRLTTKLDDHLGSTDALITSKWQNNTFTHESTEYQAYDPWGERAATTTAMAFRQADADPFRRSAQDYDRGYTGHEMLDDSGIIHMNGRLYDAELGRMLSADPYVQVPEYSQNFNRYSYVLNNPLNKTDPTGYSWLSKAFHKIGSWVKENWRTIVSVLVAAALFVFLGPGAFGLPHLGLTGAQLGAAVGAASGAFNAAINGGNLGDVLRGALIGGIQGGITGGLLGGMEPSQFGLTWDTVEHVVGHGVVGGTANEAMGGKFQDGFVSSAVSAFAGDMGWNEGGTLLSRTIKVGIIGGTASALGGGKFANGAWTAAFQHLTNYETEKFIKARRLQFAEDQLAVAESYNGLRENGPQEERNTITQFHRSTTLDSNLCKPSTAWCSSMVNYILELTGNIGTNSASSQSWLGWGRGVSEPVVGALAVFTDYDLNWRRTGQGHVGYVKGIADNNSVVVFGGNQSNMAKYSTYSRGTTKRYDEGKHIGYRKLTAYRVPNIPNRALIVAPLIRATGGNGNIESTR